MDTRSKMSDKNRPHKKSSYPIDDSDVRTFCCCLGSANRYSASTNDSTKVVTQQPKGTRDMVSGRDRTREDQWINLHQTNSDAQSKIRQLETKCAQKDDVNRQLHKETRELRDRLSRKEIECAQIHKDVHDLRTRVREANMENLESRREVDDLRTRLSSVMSAKVVNNNPNIADLSDENRPTKLGEKHMELYDNCWTDMFESMTKNGYATDTEAIELLLKLFLEINEECRQKADTDLKAMEEIARKYSVGDQRALMLKQMKDGRKKNYKADLTDINEDLVEKCVQRKAFARVPDQKTKRYASECVKLCWLMAIQDPPVHVVADRDLAGQPFDQKLYKHYMSTGKRVEYLVWPALRLHQNGPVLSKGVAQGMT